MNLQKKTLTIKKILGMVENSSREWLIGSHISPTLLVDKHVLSGVFMSHGDNEQPKRKRGFTSVALQWIAERLRRSDQIKTELQEGKYQVDTTKVAEALVSHEENRNNLN
jgi:hypothetical protein